MIRMALKQFLAHALINTAIRIDPDSILATWPQISENGFVYVNTHKLTENQAAHLREIGWKLVEL